MSARAGNPTVTLNARALGPPPTQQVALFARAGNPVASFNVRTLAPPPTQQVSILARAGNPTATLNLRATLGTFPGTPFAVRTIPTGGASADLAWVAPEIDDRTPITSYEVQLENPDGGASVYESVGLVTRYRVRGLALGHNYGFRVRARNARGAGLPSATVYATPMRMPTTTIPVGQRVPLLDLDRQSLIVRLGGRDCRVRVWWQPMDGAWYGGIEVPVNNVSTIGRRLVVGAGLLPAGSAILPGNVVLRAIDDESALVDPSRDAWRRQTHGLFWEAR